MKFPGVTDPRPRVITPDHRRQRRPQMPQRPCECGEVHQYREEHTGLMVRCGFHCKLHTTRGAT